MIYYSSLLVFLPSYVVVLGRSMLTYSSMLRFSSRALRVCRNKSCAINLWLRNEVTSDSNEHICVSFWFFIELYVNSQTSFDCPYQSLLIVFVLWIVENRSSQPRRTQSSLWLHFYTMQFSMSARVKRAPLQRSGSCRFRQLLYNINPQGICQLPIFIFFRFFHGILSPPLVPLFGFSRSRPK